MIVFAMLILFFPYNLIIIYHIFLFYFFILFFILFFFRYVYNTYGFLALIIFFWSILIMAFNTYFIYYYFIYYYSFLYTIYIHYIYILYFTLIIKDGSFFC